MKFTPEIGQEIIAALRAKLPGGKMNPCSVCSTNSWNLLDSFVPLVVSPEPLELSLGGKSQIIPNAVLICVNCGNTHFLNLNRLGLTHLLEPEPEAADAPSTPLLRPPRPRVATRAEESEE